MFIYYIEYTKGSFIDPDAVVIAENMHRALELLNAEVDDMIWTPANTKMRCLGVADKMQEEIVTVSL